METEKLFYSDSYLREFDAEVLSCEQEGNGYKAVLDRTAFFPEGGGQYADTGKLGGVRVSDTREKNGVVYHYIKEPLQVGSTVHGSLDWETRFERMQQHSGEHIVSGLVHARFGYDNVGFHLGEDSCTMDFNGPIRKEELKEIELAANRAVFANLDIRALAPDAETLKGMEYRSKIEIEGQVRIIEIPGVDTCACCAPHLAHTGEIGLIKLVDMMNYKGGERIRMLSGIRAYRDYDCRQEQAKKISAMLCEKENQIADGTARLLEAEHKLRSQVARLQQELTVYRSKEVEIRDGLALVFDKDMPGSAPRELMNQLLLRGARLCAVFAGDDEDGYRYVIGSKETDVRPVCKTLNAMCGGRGGGKPEMVQGTVKGTREEIQKVFGGTVGNGSGKK